MKVALCTHRFVPPLIGGVDVYSHRLCKALGRLGHEVVIIAVDGSAKPESEVVSIVSGEHEGFDVKRIQFSFAERPKEAFDYGYDAKIGSAIKGILQHEKPDLFIVTNFYTITLASVEASKSLGIPVIHIVTDFLPVCLRGTFVRWDETTCHLGESVKSCAACFVSHRPVGRLASSVMDILSEDRLVQLSKKQNLLPLRIIKPYLTRIEIMEKRLETIQPLREKIDLVLAPTNFTMNTFLDNGFHQRQMFLLPFGVEVDGPLSHVISSPSPNVRFLFIGRFQPYKGAHLLVEAFNNLRAADGAQLTLYGAADDNYRSYFDRLMAMIDANNHVCFAGGIDPTDLAEAFAQADYFVLPSTWHENSPLLLLDALQSRTPVIASNVGGVTDMVRDESNGLLFPMGDKQALQQVLQRAVDQPDLAVRLKSAIDLPSIDAYAEKLIELARGL